MLIKERSQSSSEVQLFLQVPRGALQMTSFWFLSIWMCLFYRFSASLPVSCAGHLDAPSHQGNFLGQSHVGYLCWWWCPALPCLVSMWFPKRIPETLCPPQPWLLLVNAGAALALEWAWIKFLSILFMYKKRKVFSCWLSYNKADDFALGCGLSAGAWWCCRDLLSCSCHNKIFTFAQISKPTLSRSYAGLQKDLMENYSVFLSGLESLPIHNICCQLSSPSPEAQSLNLSLMLTGSPLGSSSAAGVLRVCFHLSYSEPCGRWSFKKLPTYPPGWILEQRRK